MGDNSKMGRMLQLKDALAKRKKTKSLPYHEFARDTRKGQSISTVGDNSRMRARAYKQTKGRRARYSPELDEVLPGAPSGGSLQRYQDALKQSPDTFGLGPKADTSQWPRQMKIKLLKGQINSDRKTLQMTKDVKRIKKKLKG